MQPFLSPDPIPCKIKIHSVQFPNKQLLESNFSLSVPVPCFLFSLLRSCFHVCAMHFLYFNLLLLAVL